MKDEIKKIIKGDIEDSALVLEKYSHDASLFTVKPKLIIFPKDASDIRRIVKWVNENNNRPEYGTLSITARSGGTDMTGGPLNESIILDFTRYMNKLVKFDQNKMEITVELGMYYRDFEKIVSKGGLMLPSYPASKDICAMGGMFANNSGGEKTLKYGKTENYIVSSKIILSDGNEYKVSKRESKKDLLGKIYEELKVLISNNDEIIKEAKPKVSKNSAGYMIWNAWNGKSIDLNKLLVGSQGTLGLTTEITFKLVPKANDSRLAIIFLKNRNKLAELINILLKYKPESLEAYDDKTLKLAIRFFPSFLNGRGFWGAFKFMWSFWPDLFMLIRRGIPKMVIMAEFTGDQNIIKQKYENMLCGLRKINAISRLSISSADTEKYWNIRHESFNLLRKKIKGKMTAPFIDDVIVRPEYLSYFLPEIDSILANYPELEYSIAGHPGDGNFHIIPLIDRENSKLKTDIFEVSEMVYDLVVKYGGSITAEHNDGIIRTPYLKKMYSENMIKIFKNIKNIFDPNNIFNPGKKVGGTLEDIAKYL